MGSKSIETDEPATIGGRDIADAPTNETEHGEGQFDRVLVAVEAETDEAVSEIATSLAARHDARVDALSIVRMTASVDHWDMVVERREDSAEAALDAVGDAAAETDIDVAKRLRYGDPATEIARYAAETDVDLIVMGEPDRSGLRRYLAPTSVTDQVRRDASVPVLTVPSLSR
ncbi:universal stress protein [Natrinema salifodinae]|uniref:Nucleotide-binding universal stress protein, UspA family n=1 Tax=Natrinema salifodinae TaxID=1202768 RepID=A0A1I0QXV0_9EURY|nr:universal stress protein [Natrinema salifodinae]SEW32401.1 Nucleotide-binding universal stress protein, UspA family [Natrinema salifodinae]